MRVFALVFLICLSIDAFGTDLGFRYSNGKCVDQGGKEGLNPSFFGQCADMKGAVLGRLQLNDIDFSGSQFSSSDMQKTTFHRCILNGVNFDGANLSGVEFIEAKIAASSFKKSTLRNISFSEAAIAKTDFSEADFSAAQLSQFVASTSKFNGAIFDNADLSAAKLTGADFTGASLLAANLQGADLSGATLTNANFVNAMASSVNLTGAKAQKVNFTSANLTKADLTRAAITESDFRRARLDESNLSNANFEGSDFRYAVLDNVKMSQTNFKRVVFNQKTVLPFTKDDAIKQGMAFKKSVAVFLLWDQKKDSLTSFVNALTSQDIEVTLAKNVEYLYDGTESLADFQAVIHFAGITYYQDMNENGQKALINFVQAGGTYVSSEYNSYKVSTNVLRIMKELIIVRYKDDLVKTWTVTKVAEQKTHPLLSDLPETMTLPDFGGSLVEVIPPAVAVLKEGNNPVLVAREMGKGRVVSFNIGCNYRDACANPDVQKIFVSAVNYGN
jgi:uncharacterized protein YjbI with pentapeptide repeats